MKRAAVGVSAAALPFSNRTTSSVLNAEAQQRTAYRLL